MGVGWLNCPLFCFFLFVGCCFFGVGCVLWFVGGCLFCCVGCFLMLFLCGKIAYRWGLGGAVWMWLMV